MNIYAVVILTTLLIGFILNLITDILNLKALRNELPNEFKDVYDAEKYRKSQEYTRTNTKFGFITGTFGLAVTLVFWFRGGFNYLDQIVRSFQLHPIWTGLIYIGILILAKALLSLPFSIYSTFVIEEKFGFNKTTPATFVLDLLKGFALSIVLGGPLLAGILVFYNYTAEISHNSSFSTIR